MPTLGKFDLVIGSFLLNYAPNRDRLAMMSERIAAHLAPDGRFIGSIPNSDYDPRRPLDTRYSVTYDLPDDPVDGQEFVGMLHHVDPPVDDAVLPVAKPDLPGRAGTGRAGPPRRPPLAPRRRHARPVRTGLLGAVDSQSTVRDHHRPRRDIPSVINTPNLDRDPNYVSAACMASAT